jgi:vacuolar iron transporter family protein
MTAADAPPTGHDLEVWRHHLGDEADAAFLYAALASAEPDEQRRDVYRRLAGVEQRHVDLWRALFRAHGVSVEPPGPSRRARFLAWLAGRLGPSILTAALLREEGQEVRGYMRLHRESAPGPARDTALVLARESAEHARTLSGLNNASAEPWHHTGSGNVLRNVIYGFNDGLTANFGLVAGVIGAEIAPHVVLLSGLAGAVADALSMGASGYLAAKSEREVYQNEVAKERDEIRLMPDVEAEELALIYEAKGMPREQAAQLATQVLLDPARALIEKTREELGIGTASSTPLREGWITGSATAVGALIPVLPFLFLAGPSAIWTSFGLSMLAHYAVGALRTMFTGRGALRSGTDMLLVGFGVAAVGYVLGDLLAGWLSG